MAKDIQTIAAKFVQRAGAASADYAAGVKAPSKDWATQAAAAEPAYKQAVVDAANRGAYGKGVNAAGTAKWQTNAVNVGATRYPGGVANAKDSFAKGFSPMLDVLNSIAYGPRGPAGSPQNLQRVQQVADALHRKKIGQ
jgi:hypothetical protein